MALEDRLDKLNDTIERLIVEMKARREAPVKTGEWVQINKDEIADTVAAVAAAQAEPVKTRGRPRKAAATVEPEVTPEPEAVEPEVDAEDPPAEVALAPVEPEPAAPVITETQARDAVIQVKAVVGTAKAKAIIASFGLEKLADIQDKPDIWPQVYTAAMAALDDDDI